jgi:hypothetical protein
MVVGARSCRIAFGRDPDLVRSDCAHSSPAAVVDAIPGLGPASAGKIAAFFAAHPALTERARTLIIAERQNVVVPWERLQLPHQMDGSNGAFRSPRQTCTLSANNDDEAVQAWLALHESPATQRAYRRETERLILWAIIERGKTLSSPTIEDATDYRVSQRHVSAGLDRRGRGRRRSDGRSCAACQRSNAHALSVLGALFRWLIQQRYVLPTRAPSKVRSSKRTTALDTSHAFTESEWLLVRAIANKLEWSYH